MGPGGQLKCRLVYPVLPQFLGTRTLLELNFKHCCCPFAPEPEEEIIKGIMIMRQVKFRFHGRW